MAKKYVIIDIPDEQLKKYDDLYIDYKVIGYAKHPKDPSVLLCDEADLMDLPSKKVPMFDPNHCDMDEEIKICHEIFGYNRCLAEILGEIEDDE